MDLAPIALFVYNRPWHTEQTLNALAANELADESILYIYSDGPKNGASKGGIENIKKTRELIKKKKWCKEVFIIESEVNKGLANSVISGVTEVVNKHGKVIVLEDDLVTHPFFLIYMNKNLDIYEKNELVISLHGYLYPVKRKIHQPFFLKGADCWGWATWKRGWDLFEYDSRLLLNKLLERNLTREFDFNNSYGYTSLLREQIKGTVDSWAIRWYASAFLSNKLTLYPPVSLVQNIGFDGSGTHKDHIDNNTGNIFKAENFGIKEIALFEDRKIKKQIEIYFRGRNYYLRLIKKTLRHLCAFLIKKPQFHTI